jgi:serine/threonine protein kinase
VSLLERMLVLNPKKRISSRDIVLDSYFNDVKTIIPPHIYKRFEKDHLLKKTTSREVIENAEHFINIARSKLSKHHPDARPEPPMHKEDNFNSLLIPSKTETSNSNCALINFSISPRRVPAQDDRDTSRHPTPQLQSSIKLDNRQSETSSIRDTPSNGLSFRGFNPIKTNKVSVKDNRKHQESNSKEKYSHKDSRNNSIDSVRIKGKNISNSIDLGKKILNNNIVSSEPTFLI